MESLADRFSNFLETIQPTTAQQDLAKAELDFLVDRLSEYIQKDDPFEFVKALRSGSYAKATMLRRHEAGDFDADLAAYVRPASGESAEVRSLLDYIEGLLHRAYNKRTDRTPRFDRSSKSAVTIRFEQTPKINIDVVPVVALENAKIANWGAIPRRDGEQRLTSISEHIDFVRERNDDEASVPFHQLLRLTKWWRNHAFDDAEKAKVSSFFIELVLAKAYDAEESRLTGEALDDLSAIFGWILRNRLASEISFADSRVPQPTISHPGPVVVLDPVNRDNNVAHDWTVADREAFLRRAEEFCDVLRDAKIEAREDVESAVEYLEQVLPKFQEWSKE